MPKTPTDVRQLAEKDDVKIVDVKFIDLPGVWQHFSFPVEDLTDDIFEDGLGFDGSSVRGFQEIQESDMLLIPDAETARVDPLRSVPTLSLICNVQDPITRQPYTRDPRYIAQKAETYLQGSGVGDLSYWGPEAEFYVFDDVRYDQTANAAFYSVDSAEGAWKHGKSRGSQPGLQAAAQRRLLPRSAGRFTARLPLGSDPSPERIRRQGRSSPS